MERSGADPLGLTEARLVSDYMFFDDAQQHAWMLAGSDPSFPVGLECEPPADPADPDCPNWST